MNSLEVISMGKSYDFLPSEYTHVITLSTIVGT